MATAAQPQPQRPPEIVDVPMSLFGGMHMGVAPPDLPEGLSPDNQDWAFVPGEGFSRPALSAIFSPSVGGAPMVYCKTYVQPNGDPLTLAMDANGILYFEDVANNPGVPNQLAVINSGVTAFSCSAFGREYLAFSDLLSGQWCPLSYDGAYLDRVTQDGPGVGPICANVTPPTAAVANSGAGSSYTISTVTPSDPVYAYGKEGPILLYYSTLTIVTTTASGAAVGTVVSLSGITPSSFDQTNVAVTAIVTTTSFKIAYVTSIATGGTGGTVQIQQPSIVRKNNLATATTSTAHGFQVGWQVQISGIADTDIGGGIASISRDGNGNVIVTTNDPHGLPQGAQVNIVGCAATNSTEDFNGQFAVASVPSPKTFTYPQGGLADVGTLSSANVQDVWNLTAFIQSVPSTETFIYEDIGPNNLTNGSGTATIIGQISPGAHNVVVAFLDRQGGFTRPSPPVTFYANGAQQMLLTNLPIGNSSIVARLIGLTGAGGDNYFVIPATPQVGTQIVGTSTVIEDNTSTSAVIDFNDNTLFDSIAIDQTGNDLFDQRTLAAPIGFYSYASRLACWGDYAKIENLLNMTLAAGYAGQVTATNLAGSGTQSGSGTAWTNPSYITSASTSDYASCVLAAAGSSETLLAEDFAFAVDLTVLGLQASFQYYYTGGNGIVYNSQLVVQLLKAGLPFGASQAIYLNPSGGKGRGSASSPLSASFTFPVGTLQPSDVNSATFGFSVTLAGTAAVSAYVNSGAVTALSANGVPSGWLTTGSTGGTAELIISSTPGMYMQYQMVGAGGTNDCMISQPAYQDAYGTAIVLPQTQYKFRVFTIYGAGSNGNLVVDLFSPTQGTLALSSLAFGAAQAAFQFMPSFLTPAVIPADVLLRIYLQYSTSTVSIGEAALVYSLKPQTGNVSFWSYVLNPESFAQTTGILGSADDPSDIKCFSVQRNSTLLKTYAGTHTFQDNDSEPGQWQVNNLSRSVGACSIRAGDPGQFGTGDAAEDWDLTANQNGLYLFSGGNFWKISQELQKGDPGITLPTWDSIDWSREELICVKNDPKNHRSYVIAPQVNAPNLLFVLDYRELDTAADLSTAPGLKIGITGKMLSTDKTRKWTRWNVSANCMDILIRPGNGKEMTFAGGENAAGNAFGNLYTLDPAKLTDDDYGQIFPYYTTYGFVNHEQEQMLGLGTDRKLTRKLCLFATGVGYVSIIPLVDSLHNPLPATIPQLLALDTDPSNLQAEDLEWTTMIRGERVFYRFQVEPFPGSTDVQLKLQKFIPHMMKDPVIIHRGSAI